MVNRGDGRERIFRSDGDRRRFPTRLAEWPERFGVVVHAFVLMDNPCHLLMRPLDANLSRVVKSLQVSYSAQYNGVHRASGHVFQGRFKAILIEDQGRVGEVARSAP